MIQQLLRILCKRSDHRKQTVTLESIDMKVSEAIRQIQELREQLIKSKGEILGKIARLEDADGELTEAQMAAITDLRATVQQQDDLIPDDPAAPGKPIIEGDDEPPAEEDPVTGSPEVPLSTGDEEAAASEETTAPPTDEK